MSKHNAANERIKREYFHYLKHAKRRSEVSIDAAAKAIGRFEQDSRWRDFGRFHREQAVAFKTRLGEMQNARTGERLSKSTLNGTLRELRAFFLWLAGQPGYKSKIQYDDADYFNPSEHDLAIARATREKRVPTLEQAHHVLATMPGETEIQMRNRALIACALLTGARDGALASFRLRHIDLAEALVFQEGASVRTKFRKTFTTWFFPVGGDALSILTEWIERLKRQHLWGPDDALFPATKTGIGAGGGFIADGLTRDCWRSTGAIRVIFRDACDAAQLPYFNPHTLRDMLVLLGQRLCVTPEALKAWSQNLAHNDVLTTLTSYGTVPAHRQAELIRGLGKTAEGDGRLDDPDVVALIRRLAERAGLADAPAG